MGTTKDRIRGAQSKQVRGNGSKYPELFEPITIGGVTRAKGRLVMPQVRPLP